MTVIRRSDVPSYLRAGSYFVSLDADDEGVFEVPDNCFKQDTTVETNEELCLLLDSLRYWGVNDVPITAFAFLLRDHNPTTIEEHVRKFPEHEPYLQKCLEVIEASEWDSIPRAITAGLGLNVVNYLYQCEYIVSSEAMVAAASVGDIERLKFLYNETDCDWDAKVIEAAIDGGSLECLQYACENGFPVPGDAMQGAARKGRVDIVKCLREHGVPLSPTLITLAIHSKSVECVEYLHSQGCVIGSMDCGYAAHCDSVECLAFLHGHGGSMGTMLMNIACCNSLACMEYFYTHGGEWNARCCAGAAQINNLECLRYAHEHGCPWDEVTLIDAFVAKSWKCFWYALRHGCPSYKAVCVVLESVGFIVTVFYLHHDNKFVSCVVKFLSLQRCMKRIRHCGYVSMPKSARWTFLFACMDCSAVIGDLCILYFFFKKLHEEVIGE